MENLDMVVERGGKIEVSKQRSDSLIATSVTYSKRSRAVRSQMRRRRYCYMAMGIAVLLALILILLFSVCGITFSRCGN